SRWKNPSNTCGPDSASTFSNASRWHAATPMPLNECNRQKTNSSTTCGLPDETRILTNNQRSLPKHDYSTAFRLILQLEKTAMSQPVAPEVQNPVLPSRGLRALAALNRLSDALEASGASEEELRELEKALDRKT